MNAHAHPSGISVGDIVEFGRTHGEKTRGEVIKTHGGRNGTGRPLKNLKVKQLEERGTQRVRTAGTLWTVPPSLMRKVDSSKVDSSSPSTPPAPRPSRPAARTPKAILAAKGIRTADTVEFSFRGELLTGRIARINSKRVTIDDVSGYPRGVYCHPENIIRKVVASPTDR